MIKITPYYRLSSDEQNKFLDRYSEMVADAVPFLRCDVFAAFGKEDDTPGNPRQKITREKICARLPENLKKKIEKKYHSLTEKELDALLARMLILDYSEKLHDYLYEGIAEDSCHVNSNHLGDLLLLKMPQGELPQLFADFSPFPGDKSKKDNLLKYVFRYEAFSTSPMCCQLLEMLGVEICPYCNRQFTTVVPSRRIRPQLDHFKNKTDYPYLALSINNLVPSCGFCNHRKGNKTAQILYPYEEEMGDLFTFKTTNPKGIITSLDTGADSAPPDFEVELSADDKARQSPLYKHAEASIDQFALQELYQSHKGYITDLYFQRYIHTDDFMEDMIDQFPKLFVPAASEPKTEEQNRKEREAAKELLKRKLALMDYRQDAWGKRPLGKLTHDIMKEIDVKMKGHRR